MKLYPQMAARFAQWRVSRAVGAGIPSRGCIEANAQALVSHAALYQGAELVSVVEAAVLMGGEHSLQRSGEFTAEVLTLEQHCCVAADEPLDDRVSEA